MRNRGFSIVELVIVLSLISVLAVFLVPGITHLIRSNRESTTRSTFQMICNAVDAYYTVSGRNMTMPVKPLESNDDPMEFLLQNNYFNTYPLDGWGRKIRVFIVTETVTSCVGLTGTEEVDVFAGTYSINLTSAGHDKRFGSSDDLVFSSSNRVF